MEEITRELFEFTLKWFEANELWVKIASYVVSPALALYAFIGGQRTHRLLRHWSAKYAYAKKTAMDSQRDLVRETEKLSEAQTAVLQREDRIAELESDLRKLTDGKQKLWDLRPNHAFPDYHRWYMRDTGGAIVVAIGNLKGGVGKTTIAANFAAYISKHLREPVLVIDLDFQQSLSNMLLTSAGMMDVEPRVQNLFDPGANLITVERSSIHLEPSINRGWLVPSGYALSETESRLLINHLLNRNSSAGEIDERYRLASAILRPEVREGYKVIIIDMPPRLTMGSINALIACHHFFVPTVMDKLSAEAISQFLTQVKAIKTDMGLGLDLAGVVRTLTRDRRSPDWHAEVDNLIDAATAIWQPDKCFRIARTLPRRDEIAKAAGIDVVYNKASAELRDKYLDPIFAEMLTRIGLTPPPEHMESLNRNDQDVGRDFETDEL